MEDGLGEIRMTKRLLVLAVLASVCAAAYASEMSWYRWRSRISGAVVCAQISPGSAWYKFKGPYMDGTCRKPGNPQ